MARKPNPADMPDAPPALPASGGCYELVDGKLRSVQAPADAAETAPETPIETGA